MEALTSVQGVMAEGQASMRADGYVKVEESGVTGSWLKRVAVVGVGGGGQSPGAADPTQKYLEVPGRMRSFAVVPPRLLVALCLC